MTKKFVYKDWLSVRVGSKVYKVLAQDVTVLRQYASSQRKSMGWAVTNILAEMEGKSVQLINARFRTGVYGVDQIKRVCGAIAGAMIVKEVR